MANKNSNLHAAKAAKNDEFYTQLSDIEKELVHYKEHFRDKVVLCNCNDVIHGNFAKYFSLNFEFLGLKELICTSFNDEEGGHGIACRYHGDLNGNNVPDISEWEQMPMHGNGGFNTPEGIALIQEADIIVTNPPFSLFREFIGTLMEYNKKFLIIGNVNAIGYKEIFPLIMNNKLWLGVSSFNKGMYFIVDDDFVYADSYKFDKEKDGKKVSRVASVCWFTNLDHKKRHEELILYKKYNEEEYPKYDNYDAINVNRYDEIPLDYDGIMGVPITFIDKYCPEQFEIVRFRKGNDDKDLSVNGKYTYSRILIRHKK